MSRDETGLVLDIVSWQNLETKLGSGGVSRSFGSSGLEKLTLYLTKVSLVTPAVLGINVHK